MTIACKPGAQAGEHWELWIEADELHILEFSTAHDAWVFAITNFMIDPLHPQSSRKFTLRPEKIAEQMSLL